MHSKGAQNHARNTPSKLRTDPSPVATGFGWASRGRDDAGTDAVSKSPPQGEGVPRRLYTTGGPATEERLNVAIKVLRDSIARNSFSRPYSGQARNWKR